MSPNQLELQIAATQASLEKLQELLKESKKPKSLLHKIPPGLVGYGINFFINKDSHLVFKSEAKALAWAAALETMFELRHQPGTVPKSSDLQFFLHYSGPNGEKAWRVIGRLDVNVKSSYWMPVFQTEKDAYCALARVGSKKLDQARRTFTDEF